MMMSKQRFLVRRLTVNLDSSQDSLLKNIGTRSNDVKLYKSSKRSYFGSRGNQRRQQRVAKRRQRGAAPPGVLDHRSRSSSAPALALPACSRNRGAEGGCLRGPNRSVLALPVLPTPRVVAGCSLARSSAGWSPLSRRLCRSSLASCRAGLSRQATDASTSPEMK